MDKHAWITQEMLHRWFKYDAEAGTFVRRRADGRMGRGKVGTTHRLGYHVIGIAKKLYYAHRLAWMYHYGVWPTGELDHINGVRDDNRISNLREVDRQSNMQNIRAKKRIANATSKFLGVSFQPRCKSRPWRAVVSKNGKNYCCGHWATEEEAHEAYLLKKRELHEGCTI